MTISAKSNAQATNRLKSPTAKRAPTAGSFKPGNIANPTGRPKRTPEELTLVEMCRAKTPDALAVIVDLMVNGQQERTKLSAAEFVVERAYGKAVQSVEMSGKDGAAMIIECIERVIVRPGDV